MTPTTTDSLATQLDTLIRTVPGVTALYSAAPVPEQALGTVRRLLPGNPGTTACTWITTTDRGMSIHIHIGVHEKSPAPTICRDVYAAVELFLRATPQLVPVSVQVKVGRIG